MTRGMPKPQKYMHSFCAQRAAVQGLLHSVRLNTASAQELTLLHKMHIVTYMIRYTHRNACVLGLCALRPVVLEKQ